MVSVMLNNMKFYHGWDWILEAQVPIVKAFSYMHVYQWLWTSGVTATLGLQDAPYAVNADGDHRSAASIPKIQLRPPRPFSAARADIEPSHEPHPQRPYPAARADAEPSHKPHPQRPYPAARADVEPSHQPHPQRPDPSARAYVESSHQPHPKKTDPATQVQVPPDGQAGSPRMRTAQDTLQTQTELVVSVTGTFIYSLAYFRPLLAVSLSR